MPIETKIDLASAAIKEFESIRDHLIDLKGTTLNSPLQTSIDSANSAVETFKKVKMKLEAEPK